MALPGLNMMATKLPSKSLPYYWTIDEGIANLRERLKRSQDTSALQNKLEGGKSLKRLLRTVPLAQRKQIVAFINSI